MMPHAPRSHRQTKYLVILSVLFLIVGFIAYRYTVKQPLQPKNSSLLSGPLVLSGNKSVANTQIPVAMSIKDTDIVRITYNLHGLCAGDGDASAFGFMTKEGKKIEVSLDQYGANCTDVEQRVDIPITQFTNFAPSEITQFYSQFWYPTEFLVEIKQVALLSGESTVLGETTQPKSPVHNKTYPNVTPLVPAYATESIEE